MSESANEIGTGDGEQASAAVPGPANEELKQQAAHLGGVARDQLKTQLTSQKGRLATQLGAVSDVLEQGSQQLRQQERAGMADYPDTAARQLRSLSEQLGQTDVDQLVEKAQQVARERPALFLGAAFGLGLLGARFVKSGPGSSVQPSSYAAQSPSVDTSSDMAAGVYRPTETNPEVPATYPNANRT